MLLIRIVNDHVMASRRRPALDSTKVLFRSSCGLPADRNVFFWPDCSNKLVEVSHRLGGQAGNPIPLPVQSTQQCM